jgi:hypothetical protein
VEDEMKHLKRALKSERTGAVALVALALGACNPFADAPPKVANGALEVVSVTRSSVELRWQAASDGESAHLSYCVVRADSPEAIDTAQEADQRELVVYPWNSDMTAAKFGMPSASFGWFNVLVRDDAGNLAVYEPVSARTLDYHGEVVPFSEYAPELRLQHSRGSYAATGLLARGDGSLVAYGIANQGSVVLSFPDAAHEAGTPPPSKAIAPRFLQNLYWIESAAAVRLADDSLIVGATTRKIESNSSTDIDPRGVMLARLSAQNEWVTDWGARDPEALLADGITHVDASFNGAFRNVCGALAVARVEGREVVYVAGHSASYYGNRTEEDVSFVDWGLMRVDPETGRLDESFGAQGYAATGIQGKAIAVQDGRLVVAGLDWSDRERIVVGRFGLDGQPDAGFGAGAFVHTGLTGLGAMVVGADGAIYLAGNRLVERTFHPAVVKLSADGAFDSTFGTGGVLTLDAVLGRLHTLAFHPTEGSLLVAGERGDKDTYSYARYQGHEVKEMLVAKIAPADGRLFASGEQEFGEEGFVYPKIGYVTYERQNPSSVMGMAFRADGRIVLGGHLRIFNTVDSNYFQPMVLVQLAN